MLNRYLQIGIIAVAVALLATALITTKSDSRGQQSEAIKVEAVTAEQTTNNPAPSIKPTKNRAKANAANSSKAVLDVQGMSCSGCIYEIKSSLAKLDGVGDVLVDINSGRVEVYYDDAKLKEVGQIASAITAVGYPASLKRTLTADENEKENSILESRSKLYIAAVGDWEIARDDFNIDATISSPDLIDGRRNCWWIGLNC